MKKPITPLAIIAVFVVFILAQSSVSYSSMPAITSNETSFMVRDTVPEQQEPDKKKEKKEKKKERKEEKKRERDTSNWPQKEPTPVPDTFPSANRP